MASKSLADLQAAGSDVDTGLIGSATGAAAAIAPAIAAIGGTWNYLTGILVTGAGATAASVITVTVTGCVGGTLSFNIAVPAGAAVGITPLLLMFPRPIPATGPNLAITLNVPSFGAGNTNVAAVIFGFRRAV